MTNDLERVSVLVGDRLCVRCGYNLTGQPVVREPHYQLLVVRCPECATVAGLQDYPLLGRWAGRWAALIAALWFVVLLGLSIGSAAAMFGISLGSSEESSRAYRRHLASLHEEWLGELHPNQDVSATWNFEPFGDFWKTVDPAVVLADAGGWLEVVDWSAAFFWILVALFAAAIGIFWATALLHLRRRGLLIFGLLLIAVPSAIAIAANWSDFRGNDVEWVGEASWHQVGQPFMALTLLITLTALWIGLMIGRAAMRGLIRLLLPPRLRAPLALLWTRDGLDPPR